MMKKNAHGARPRGLRLFSDIEFGVVVSKDAG
jgi:hypothetical protein